MNISFNKDAVSGVLKIEIRKEDYNERVETSLRDLRRKANLPGFRKGMVPMGMISKMYGKQVLGEEVNKLVSENLSNYIRENRIEILGDPLLSTTEQKEIDFDRQEDFEFYFDLALSPDVNVELTGEDKLTCYRIRVDDDLVNKQIESYQASFGAYDTGAEVADEKDMIKGKLVELENGAPKEGGLVVEDALLMPMYVKDEEEKRIFIGAKKGSTLVFNPHKAYAGAEAEIAAFLKIEKAGVAEKTGDFSFEIEEITHFKEAEVNRELFDKVLGKDEVTDEEAFRGRVRDFLCEQYDLQSDFKFRMDVRTFLLGKMSGIALADDILKRWVATQEADKTTGEQLEETYPLIAENLKYHLIKDSIIKKNDLQVEEEDVEVAARKMAKEDCVQYGMFFVPDELISGIANNMLKDKNTFQKAIERARDDKFINWVKNNLSLDIKEVSTEEFTKILQPEVQEQPA
ncbi:MAG: trigger factor [Tannerellaceae bacterium]|jgi:trigger factor|nr:trigger factor [Tannerellaceae bacterium]